MPPTHYYDVCIHSPIMGHPQKASAASMGSNPWFDGDFGGQGDCYQPVTVTTKGLCNAGLALWM